MAEVAKSWYSCIRLSASRYRPVLAVLVCMAEQGRRGAGQDAEQSPTDVTGVASCPDATLVPHIPGWGEWMWYRNASGGLALRLLFATQPANISCYWPWKWPPPHDVPKTAREQWWLREGSWMVGWKSFCHWRWCPCLSFSQYHGFLYSSPELSFGPLDLWRGRELTGSWCLVIFCCFWVF